jgi:hypothetical protein
MTCRVNRIDHFVINKLGELIDVVNALRPLVEKLSIGLKIAHENIAYLESKSHELKSKATEKCGEVLSEIKPNSSFTTIFGVDPDDLKVGTWYLVKTDYGYYAGVFSGFYADIVAIIVPFKDEKRTFVIEIPKSDIKSIEKLML